MSKLSENISALMDGQADDVTLTRLCRDDELKRTWESYHVIRDAIKGELPSNINLGLSQRISDAIADEDTFDVKPIQTHKNTWNSTFKRIGGMAIAASVAFAVVVGLDGTGSGTPKSPNGVVAEAPDNLTTQAAPIASATVAISSDDMSDAEKQRLAMYLEKHNTQSVKRQLDKKPFVRVVNYKYPNQ